MGHSLIPYYCKNLGSFEYCSQKVIVSQSLFNMLISGFSITEQSISNQLKPSFVSVIRPNQDGSHGNLFNTYHLQEVCIELNRNWDILYSPPEKTVHRSPVAVIICVYNEEWYSLKRTLDSLTFPLKKSVDSDIFTNTVDLDIAIVIDGLEKLKPCMKKYLQTHFGPAIPLNTDEDWKTECMTVSFKIIHHYCLCVWAIYYLLNIRPGI